MGFSYDANTRIVCLLHSTDSKLVNIAEDRYIFWKVTSFDTGSGFDPHLCIAHSDCLGVQQSPWFLKNLTLSPNYNKKTIGEIEKEVLQKGIKILF